MASNALSMAIDPAALAIAEENMLSKSAEGRAEKILSSLCDPTRLKIVRALRDTPLPASDIARLVERTRAATSQHLRVLREVDAIVPTRRGNVVRYSLSSNLSASILDDIARAFDRLENP